MFTPNIKQTQLALGPEEYSVFQCLCYYRIFSYPLKQSEILAFCDRELSLEYLQESLQQLLNKAIVFEHNGYYSCDVDISKQIEQRLECEKRFESMLPKIKRYARLVSMFPFVEFVGISGSCAKGLFSKKADVDYFIITKPGKLWLCRTLLILFKKLILLNSRTFFCLNYFIDSNNLEIPDKNLFVAHELMALSPVNNLELHAAFLKANTWAVEKFPNANPVNKKLLVNQQSTWQWRKIVEPLFENKIGNKLENFLLKYTLATWKKRFPHLGNEEFEVRFRSKPNVSKHHPRGFQDKVLREMQVGLEQVSISV